MNDHESAADALRRARSLLRTLAGSGDLDDLLRQALDTAEELTGSKIGFFHFVDDDQESLTLTAWSSHTLTSMCTASGRGSHYPVTQAGVWVDCFRARQPVVHNDYAALPYRKGLPPGHAAILRELTVPVIRDGKVVAIAGVGNKRTAYDDADVRTFQELANEVVDLAAGLRQGKPGESPG